MEFFNFLKKESSDLDRNLILAGGFAGIVNTLLIFILTAAAARATRGQSTFVELLEFALCLWAFWVSKGYFMRRTSIIVETIIETMRLRITRKIRSAELASFESLGSAPLYNAISNHTVNISRGTSGILSASTSLILLACAFLVIFFLSAAAFCILLATLFLILAAFFLDRLKLRAAIDDATRDDNRFVKGFGDLLAGFKELKMNSAKNRDFFSSNIEPLAAQARDARINANMIINRGVLLATSALFILLAAVVFLLPVFAPADAPKLARIATLIVFIFGPLGEVVGVYPFFAEAVASIREINRVESELNTIIESNGADPVPDSPATLSFNSIQCKDLTFSYRDDKGEKSFSLAPLSVTLPKGSLTFIAGGNGSGKSTFLKVLAGLYPPASGSIQIDANPVGPHNRQSYRDLFAPIFSDFHLFDQLYGIDPVDHPRAIELLHMTEIGQKTSFVGKTISHINLSTGQRKRLALVIALLEDKPIALFDEWASEQDPAFRRKFYREILPALKQSGKTIVAVTHDDDHYDVADRVLWMRYGQFEAHNPQPPQA